MKEVKHVIELSNKENFILKVALLIFVSCEQIPKDDRNIALDMWLKLCE